MIGIGIYKQYIFYSYAMFYLLISLNQFLV